MKHEHHLVSIREQASATPQLDASRRGKEGLKFSHNENTEGTHRRGEGGGEPAT